MPMSFEELTTKNDLEELEKRILEKFENLITQSGPQQKKWLRSKDVQDMLGISSSSLQNMRINGVLPFSKVQGTIFYELGDVLKVLDQNKITHQNLSAA